MSWEWETLRQTGLCDERSILLDTQGSLVCSRSGRVYGMWACVTDNLHSSTPRGL